MFDRSLPWAAIVIATGMAPAATLESAEPGPRLEAYIGARVAECDRIPAERRELLGEIVAFAQSQRGKGAPIKLNFICTHNSRRSQMAQVWATLAASHYGVDDVEAYSGGTEGTALNPRAAAALVRTGVAIEPRASDERSDNPRYEVRFGRGERLICFSKAYDQDPNPKSDFAAVMVCAEADENCPNIAGAQVRISLPYVDPKAADGTPGEAEAYDQRCAQIAREMLFVFAEVSKTR